MSDFKKEIIDIIRIYDKGLHPSSMNPPQFTTPFEYKLPETDQQKRAKKIKLGATCTGLDPLTAWRARDIETILALLITNGSINPDNLSGNVIDFGTGTGPGAYILQQYGGTVTGVDTERFGIETAIQQRILPPERAIVQNGFEYLSTLQPNSVDFIAAFMMHSGFPHARLYHEANRVLKPKGQLLINGGLTELELELIQTVSQYGKIEQTIVPSGDKILGYVNFISTKKE